MQKAVIAKWIYTISYTDDYTYTMNDYDLVLESGNDVYVTGKKHIILSTFDEVQKYETYIMVSN